MKENLIESNKEASTIIPLEKCPYGDNSAFLKETLKLSLKLGLITFGGPISHIGLFHKYLIEDNRLISDKLLLSYLLYAISFQVQHLLSF